MFGGRGGGLAFELIDKIDVDEAVAGGGMEVESAILAASFWAENIAKR